LVERPDSIVHCPADALLQNQGGVLVTVGRLCGQRGSADPDSGRCHGKASAHRLQRF